MERKDPPAGAPGADAAPGEQPSDDRQGRGRRRFGEGETVVMRLDELLRSRPAGGQAARGGGQAGGSGEKTQVVSLADLQLNLAHQTERTIRSGQLSESQVALLQRTEPRASSDHSRSGPTPARDARPPAPPPSPPAAPAGGSVWGPLGNESDAPPGVATRIGPLPASLGQPRAKVAPPPPPAGNGELATVPGVPAPERVRGNEAEDVGWSQPSPAEAAFRPRATPPPPPPVAERPNRRDEQTDPGSPSPFVARAKAATPPPPPASASAPAEHAAATPAASVEATRATPAAARIKRRVVNQVVVFFSCKGGSGATALAANTAYAAVQAQQTACIFDVDLQLGDALAAFGLTPRFSISQAIHLAHERQQLSRSLLPSHTSGVHVLSQVGNLNDLDKITPEAVSSLLPSLRQHFETVIVDGVRDFGDNVLAMLDAADKVVIVCVQEVLAIRRARWAFGILRKIGFEAEDLTLVVNRYNVDNEIPLGSISTMFEGAQVVPLVGDAALVTQSLNRGVPLAELRADHPLVAGMDRLSGHLFFNDAAGVPPAAQTPDAGPQGSFLKRMFRGKGARQQP